VAEASPLRRSADGWGKMRITSEWICLSGNQFEIGGAEGGLKQAAIFEDVFAGVPFHEAEVQNFFRIRAG